MPNVLHTKTDVKNVAAPKAMVTALEHTKGLTVKTSPDAAAAIKKVKDGDEDAALVFAPKGDGSFTVRLYTSNTSATQAGILKGIVFGAADRVSIAATGGPPALAFRAVSVDSASLSYIDFLLPGIVALSIMQRSPSFSRSGSSQTITIPPA